MIDFLQLRSLKTLEVVSDEDRYIVKAEGVSSWTACPLCKRGRLYGHGSQEQSFQDTPSHGKPVEVFICHRVVQGYVNATYRSREGQGVAQIVASDLPGVVAAVARGVEVGSDVVFSRQDISDRITAGRGEGC